MDNDKEDAILLGNQYDQAGSYSAVIEIERSFSQTRESGRTLIVDTQPSGSTSINTDELPITNQQSSASTANSPQSPGSISTANSRLSHGHISFANSPLSPGNISTAYSPLTPWNVSPLGVSTAANDTENSKSNPKEIGCMVCRHSTRLDQEMIRRNLPILERGDHIQMPLKNSCFGLCCRHHAIVDEFEIENGTHKLSVIEVAVGENMKLNIEANTYDTNTDLEQIELIEYRKRKFNHGETYTRACELQRTQEPLENADSESSEPCSSITTCMKKYRMKKNNLLHRNCEHFSAACVNGDDDLLLDNVHKSTSLQSAKCCWLLFDFIIGVFQCLFFIGNFYIFATFAMKKQSYNHFPDWFVRFVHLIDCVHTERHMRGFLTDCDWKVIGMFSSLFAIAFVVLLGYQCYLKGHMAVCNECLCTKRIVYWVKVVLFVSVEIGNVFLEEPLFNWIDWLYYEQGFTLFVLAMISIVETLIVTFAATWIGRCLIYYCSFPCCLKCPSRCFFGFPCCLKRCCCDYSEKCSSCCYKCSKWLCAFSPMCSCKCCKKCPNRCRMCCKVCCIGCYFEEDAYRYVVRNISCNDITFCLDETLLCRPCCRKHRIKEI